MKKESEVKNDVFDSADNGRIETDVAVKTPRLKFLVKIPKLPVRHPGHILPQRRYPSFRDWLEHDDSLSGEDPKRLTEEDAKREARLRMRILEASQPGGVLSEEKCSVYVPDPQDEPDRQYSHQDHLVAQAIHFRKLMNNERRHHLNAAKRIAHAAAAEWKRRQPKTAEEVLEEQKEVNLARYKQVRKDLQAKWDVVSAEVNRRRRLRWEEEQQLLGKQALNEMLEHSTQLLDARVARRSSEASSNAAFETGGSIAAEDNEDGTSGEEDESNMSSSQSSSEEAPQDDEADIDEGLSVEELRRKYSYLSGVGPVGVSVAATQGLPIRRQIEALPVPVSPRSPRKSHEDYGHGQENEATGALPEIGPRETRSRLAELEGLDEELAEETDESIDMDDDMGESDDDEGNETSDGSIESDEEEINEADRGILGFFSPEDLLTRDAGTAGLDKPANDTGNDTIKAHETEDAAQTIPGPNRSGPGPPVSKSNQTASSITTINCPPARTNQNLNLNIETHPISRDPSSQASPGTVATTKASEMDSASSLGLHADSRHPSSATTPQPSFHLKTPIPPLLRGTLREYQHYGLDWLAGLYANGTNGILADEMGLGKTIQTIALLAHLACHYEVWGPHLIVVPTSVMLNWEMEFKKWCPGFKILTYYGTQEERKQKRKGWLNDNLWNVCITSYQLVLQDQQSFKRRNWHYMVLDEAHNIKNFRSQRWQTLLTFKTRARLLLTGTPLQNNLTELWSLLFFLMPSETAEGGIGGFADLKEFSEWFRRPVEQILEHGRETMDDEARAIVAKLHKVLRPYLLRRLKADVEKQMPAKHEHVVYCRLSKRQRYLYDGFMSLAQTRETLKSGNYLSIINCLMQLRKVCNHPDLFETRPIVTSFAMPKAAVADYEIKELLCRRRLLKEDPMTKVDIGFMNYIPVANEWMAHTEAWETSHLMAVRPLQDLCKRQYSRVDRKMNFSGDTIDSALAYLENVAKLSVVEELRHCVYLTALRSQKRPIYGSGLVSMLMIDTPLDRVLRPPRRRAQLSEWQLHRSDAVRDMVLTLSERSQTMVTSVQKFACITPAVTAPDLVQLTLTRAGVTTVQDTQKVYTEDPFHEARMCLSIAFPDKRLLQYDCGKLQRLDKLLRGLKTGGHRALIFTQMTKVLDILEQFLNMHGHRYLRLDGATKVEQRQVLTDRFNNDPRILVFILSSRSGGLGINLTGADTVIFYDLDWNPAMDKQCQDRCHRIGQTRDVHIYRFVSEYTIESNILRKANQKRMLDDVVIQEGEFTTDYFNKISVRDMLGEDDHGSSVMDGDAFANAAMDRVLGAAAGGAGNVERVLEQVEDKEDTAAAKMAEKELVHTDEADFVEDKSFTGSTTPKTTSAGTPRELVAPLVSTPLFTPVAMDSSVRTTVVAIPVPEQTESNSLVSPEAAPDSKMITAGPGLEERITQQAKQDGQEDDEEPGHIDEYMLRFMEWDLKDVPVSASVDRAKGKAGVGARKPGPKKAQRGRGRR